MIIHVMRKNNNVIKLNNKYDYKGNKKIKMNTIIIAVIRYKMKIMIKMYTFTIMTKLAIISNQNVLIIKNILINMVKLAIIISICSL